MYEKIKLCIITFIIAFVIGTISTCIYTTGRTKELEARALQLRTKLADYGQSKADNDKGFKELGEEITGSYIESGIIRNQAGEITAGLFDFSKEFEDFGKGLSSNRKGIDGIYKRLSEIIESEEATNKSNSD